MKTLIALAAAGVLASTTVAAGPTAARIDRQSYPAVLTPVQYSDDRSATIDERESRITERIQRGMNDGKITNREARRLQRELDAIEAKERAFKNDGRLSRRETDELTRDLNRLADHVRQQMRDEERY